MMFRSKYFSYAVGADGTNGAFTDLRTGRDYSLGGHFAEVKLAPDGRKAVSNRAEFRNGTISVGFEGIAATAEITVAEREGYVQFELTGLDPAGAEIRELSFCLVKLGLEYGGGEDFVPTMLAMNLRTNVEALPGFSNKMGAICCDRFGFVGTKAAIAAAPEAAIRDCMKEIATEAAATGDIVISAIGGPWAKDAEINNGSYCFNFHGIGLDDVDEWIETAKKYGITQLDFHGGQSFRFGDLAPNPARYPEGRKSLREVIDRIHAAGMKAGLHTYAFFMDKKSEWVTPVPSRDLGYSKKFTLAAPLSTPANAAVPAAADDPGETIYVNESTEGLDAVTGFFVFNSTLLRIGDELISFSGVSKEKPYGFTGCRRGARGTVASAHAAGEEAFHLKECFGLLCPEPDTKLFDAVCQRHADMYNECGFDMMYFDALDGEAILAGPEYAWHYGSKFIFEIVKRIERTAVIEYSTHHHHLWYTRSRMGAWDTPTRSYKRFIDMHAANNQLICDRQYLPGHLGWWTTNPQLTIREQERRTQYERMFSDDIEYLCCKCTGNGYGLSIMHIEKRYTAAQGVEEYGRLLSAYEKLRVAGRFPAGLRAEMKQPGREFHLTETVPEKYSIAPATYHTARLDHDSGDLELENPYADQKPFIRIEALLESEAYDAPGAKPLTGASAPAAESLISASEGCVLTVKETAGSDGGDELIYSAVNAGGAAAGWACLKRKFAEPQNLADAQTIGVWIHGDGNGEAVNIQLNSPRHIVGGFSDHLVRIDFKGWKYFSLIENDGGKMPDIAWPYDPEYYWVYREAAHYSHIDTLSIWCAGIPAGGSADLRFRPAKAVPAASHTLEDPTVGFARFNVKMDSLTYLEYDPATGACRHFDALGNLIGDVAISGEPPTLRAGANRLKTHFHGRAKLTLRTLGKETAI